MRERWLPPRRHRRTKKESKLKGTTFTAGGSQGPREVTTVSGATSIKIMVTFAHRDGKVLLEKEIDGNVRFFGENLRATYDFAKKIADAINENF